MCQGAGTVADHDVTGATQLGQREDKLEPLKADEKGDATFMAPVSLSTPTAPSTPTKEEVIKSWDMSTQMTTVIGAATDEIWNIYADAYQYEKTTNNPSDSDSSSDFHRAALQAVASAACKELGMRLAASAVVIRARDEEIAALQSSAGKRLGEEIKLGRAKDAEIARLKELTGRKA
jgi:hypothetical protein